MCDPSSLLSTAVGAGGKAVDAFGRADAARQQDKANKDDAMRRLQLMQQHFATQDRYRGQGEGAWRAALEDMSAPSQIGRQSQEAARLSSYYNGDTGPLQGVPSAPSLSIKSYTENPGGGLGGFTNAPAPNTAIAAPPSTSGGFTFDPRIAGSSQGGDVFQADLAAKLGAAAQAARSQNNALATINSYGGSYGGLGTVNPLIMQKSADAIDLWNNMRKGDLAVWDVEKRVPAAQYAYKGSPASALAGLFPSGMKNMGTAASGWKTPQQLF